MFNVGVRVLSTVWLLVAAALAGVIVGVVVMSAWRADAAPGTSDSTFVPVENCRLFDFRAGVNNVGPKNTPLGPGDSNTYTQQVTGANGNCVIPDDAVAVSMNVTVTDPTAQSNLRIFPADQPTPVASSLNWVAGQSPTPNKVVTKLSATGAFALFNANGSVNVLADVDGYFTSSTLVELDARLAALESASAADQATIAELQAKLADVSVVTVDGQRTVRLTGVNLQLVDGSGVTECGPNEPALCSGVGNLIVGYNEQSNPGSQRTGSHNVVVGREHEWTSHSAIATGRENVVSAPYTAVVGGSLNEATDTWATVLGGWDNSASKYGASVVGGWDNAATGSYSTVAGGEDNIASGYSTAVSGGEGNTASGRFAAVSGGFDNSATGRWSAVSGGQTNVASGYYSSVSGGGGNIAAASESSISGGADNAATGESAAVAGGSLNNAQGANDSVVGGAGITCTGPSSIVCAPSGQL